MWVSVKEKMPESKEWCWIWWEWDSGDGYCDKMFLNSAGKWMKNTLSTVKDEYTEYIKAWQPYYEPEPYKN